MIAAIRIILPDLTSCAHLKDSIGWIFTNYFERINGLTNGLAPPVFLRYWTCIIIYTICDKRTSQHIRATQNKNEMKIRKSLLPYLLNAITIYNDTKFDITIYVIAPKYSFNAQQIIHIPSNTHIRVFPFDASQHCLTYLTAHVKTHNPKPNNYMIENKQLKKGTTYIFTEEDVKI